MKRRILKIVSIIIISALVLWLLEIIWFLFFLSSKPATGDSSMDSSIVFPYSDTAFGGIFNSSKLDVNLPYHIYQKKMDSINSRNDSTSGKGLYGAGFSVLNVGGYSEDSPSALKKAGKNFSEKYVIKVKDYKLNPECEIYYREGNCMLVYPVYDTTDQYGKHGYYESRPLPFCYNEEAKEILIPITSFQFQLYRILLIAIGLIYFITSIMSTFMLPISLVLSISKGHFFRKSSLTILRNIFVLGFIALFFSYGVKLIFLLVGWIYLPSEFSYNLDKGIDIFQILDNVFYPFLAMAFYLAFKRGYNLQKEQDLTV